MFCHRIDVCKWKGCALNQLAWSSRVNPGVMCARRAVTLGQGSAGFVLVFSRPVKTNRLPSSCRLTLVASFD